jgi:predicted transcriptional regulator
MGTIPRYDAEQFIETLDEQGTTTEEVEDRLDCAKQTAIRHLDILAAAGEVEKRRISNGYVWYPNE